MPDFPSDQDHNWSIGQKTEASMSFGILGGGQLAQMLADAARKLGLSPHVFAHRPDDVAISHADAHVLGSLDDQRALHTFFQSIDTCVYENEWVQPDLLKDAIYGTQAKLVPQPEAMAACGDKLQQKELLLRLGIPSSRFVSLSPGDSISVQDWLVSLAQHFPNGCVLKWSKGGYDGKGTMRFQPTATGVDGSNPAFTFVDQAMIRRVSVYAEELVNFERELALLTIRQHSGACSYYPLVCTEQEQGICVVVRGPALAMGVPPELEPLAQTYGQKIGQELQLIGVFAIEFFLDQSGQLLVNEIAPRVHNSGHFTMNGAASSQFENHVRAALDWPLADLNCHKFFGMVNILGPEAYVGPLDPPRLNLGSSSLHWYEKRESRAARKIGHVNVWADSSAELENLLTQARNELDQWSKSVSQVQS